MRWMRTGRMGLQPQLARAVLPKQASNPDIPPYHLNRPMPGLIHNRPLRSARKRRTGGVPGPEGMPRILRRVQPDPVRQFLDAARRACRYATACRQRRKLGVPRMARNRKFG